MLIRSSQSSKLSAISGTFGIRRLIRAIGDTRKSIATLDSGDPPPDPLLPRGLERVLLRLLGRPILCEICGRQLFFGLPLVWRGHVWLIGAYNAVAHVSFVSSERMAFRHAQLDECPAPERPWVPER